MNGSAVEARFRDRLAEHIQELLTQMSTAAFARRCTATQLVQAASFPLAVALRGRRKGWVKEDLAELWAQQFSILFRCKFIDNEGLLRDVERRYIENDQLVTFNDVVGDGTLSLVLVATLSGTNWHGVGADIDKAVVIREVFVIGAAARVGTARPNCRAAWQDTGRGWESVHRVCRAGSYKAAWRARVHTETILGSGDEGAGEVRYHTQGRRSAMARPSGLGRVSQRGALARRV